MQVHFWSRSRDELWRKGATSGNTMTVRSIREDCDGDALLIEVAPAGSCLPHRGDHVLRSGESRATGLRRSGGPVGDHRQERDRIGRRVPTRPISSIGGPTPRPARCSRRPGRWPLPPRTTPPGPEMPDRVAEESADLIYHLLVLLADRGHRSARRDR